MKPKKGDGGSAPVAAGHAPSWDDLMTATVEPPPGWTRGVTAQAQSPEQALAVQPYLDPNRPLPVGPFQRGIPTTASMADIETLAVAPPTEQEIAARNVRQMSQLPGWLQTRLAQSAIVEPEPAMTPKLGGLPGLLGVTPAPDQAGASVGERLFVELANPAVRMTAAPIAQVAESLARPTDQTNTQQPGLLRSLVRQVADAPHDAEQFLADNPPQSNVEALARRGASAIGMTAPLAIGASGLPGVVAHGAGRVGQAVAGPVGRAAGGLAGFTAGETVPEAIYRGEPVSESLKQAAASPVHVAGDVAGLPDMVRAALAAKSPEELNETLKPIEGVATLIGLEAHGKLKARQQARDAVARARGEQSIKTVDTPAILEQAAHPARPITQPIPAEGVTAEQAAPPDVRTVRLGEVVGEREASDMQRAGFIEPPAAVSPFETRAAEARARLAQREQVLPPEVKELVAPAIEPAAEAPRQEVVPEPYTPERTRKQPGLLEIYSRYADLIEADPAYTTTSEQGDYGATESAARTNYKLPNTREGLSYAREIRERLPENLRGLVAVAKKGERLTTTDLDKVMEIGPEAAAEAIIFGSSRAARNRVRSLIEFAEKNADLMDPIEKYAIQSHLRRQEVIADRRAEDFVKPEGAKRRVKSKEYAETLKATSRRNPDVIDSAQLAVGDEMTIAGESFKVTDVTPEGVVVKDGITHYLPEGMPIAVDRGSFKKAPPDTSFDPFELSRERETTESQLPPEVREVIATEPPKSPADSTGLFGQQMFDAVTGEQRNLMFGGEDVTVKREAPPEPVRTADEAKIARKFDREATPTLESQLPPDVREAVMGASKQKEPTVRVVHLGPPQAEQGIRETGLTYRSDLSETARAWADPEQAQYSSTDPRFGGMSAYVFDVPLSEYQKHANAKTATGALPGKYLTEVRPPTEKPVATEAKPTESPPTKEPWQMTRAEFEAQPNVVYHGRKGEYQITSSRPMATTGNPTSHLGAFFSPQKWEAERMVKNFHGGKGKVQAAVLDLKKPYEMSFVDFDKLIDVDWKNMHLQEGMAVIRQRVDALKSRLQAEGYDGIIVGKPGKPRAQEAIAFADSSIIQHRYAVESALRDGKPVPAEVLKDYPDLAAKYGKEAATPDTAGPSVPSERGAGPALNAKGEVTTSEQPAIVPATRPEGSQQASDISPARRPGDVETTPVPVTEKTRENVSTEAVQRQAEGQAQEGLLTRPAAQAQPAAETPARKGSAKPPHFAVYNDKVIPMDYIPDPKQQFRFAGQRIIDNNAEGFVVTPKGEVFSITKGSRLAKPVTGEAKQSAIDKVAAYQIAQSATPARSFGEKLSDAAQKARARREKAIQDGQLFSNPLDPQTLSDYAVIGADLMYRGAKSVKDFTEKLVAEFGERVRPHVAAIYVEARKSLGKEAPEILIGEGLDERAIGLKKAEIAKLRDAINLEELPEPKRIAHVERLNRALESRAYERALDDAQAALKAGVVPDAATHAALVVEAARKLNALEDSIKTVSDLVQKGNTEGAKLERARADALAEQLDDLTRASDMAGTEAARALSIRRMMLNRDTWSLEKVLQQARSVKGERLTTDEIARFQKLTEEHAQLTAELDAARKAYAEKEAEVEKLRATTTVEGESLRRVRTPSRRDRILAERADIMKKLVGLGFRMNDITGVSAEAAYLVGRLAMTYIHEGVASLPDVVRRVRERFPELSDLDVYKSLNARNPDAQKRARTDAELRVRDLKAQASIMEKIDALEHGAMEPRRTVTGGIEPSPDLRKLRNQLTELRKSAYKTIREGDQLARAVAHINELQDLLANHARAVKKHRQPDSERVSQAKETIRQLRREMRVEDELQRLNGQMESGEFEVREQRTAKPIPLELEKKELALKRARREITQVLNEMSRPTASKVGREAVNFLRTIKATADFSAVLRQGLVHTLKHPGAAAGAFVDAAKAFASQNSADRIDNALRNAPEHFLREKAGLQMSDLDGSPNSREEYFMSRWAERIPGFGKIVRASDRHMTTYLNLMRAAAFDHYAKSYPNATPQELSAWADYVNAASGKGDLGRFKSAAGILGAVIFAPKFAASRFQTPYKLVKHWEHPRVRKEIAKSLATTAGAGITALALAHLSGAGVTLDPRDPDFGKIVIGNEHYDIWAGFQQPMRLVSRIALAATDRAGLTGDDLMAGDEDFSPLEAVGRFAAFKLAPAVTIPQELLSGRDMVGQAVTPTETVASAMLPILVQEIYETARAEGATSAARSGLASFLGIGANTYPESKSKARRSIYNLMREGEQAEARRKADDWNRKNPKNPIRALPTKSALKNRAG